MAGGNYVPQMPAFTWEKRYGDCKAKALLLLAMLRALDIEAEPVLASVGAGGLWASGSPRLARSTTCWCVRGVGGGASGSTAPARGRALRT